MTWIAQLLCQGSSDVPPAFAESGSKPPPIPALEQNSAIGPNRRSVSSMTCRMSFSWATSHLNAAPSMEAVTACAPPLSTSATITLAAPVTTTTLPVTCIAASRFYVLSGQNQIEHGGVVAGGAQQHETMPDRVLEAQPSPGVKDHAETIERATGEHEPQRQFRQRCHHRIVEHDAAPAERQIEPDRDAVEAAGPAKLEHDAEDRDAPHADQQRDGEHAVLQLHDDGCIGRRDQEEDCRVV